MNIHLEDFKELIKKELDQEEKSAYREAELRFEIILDKVVPSNSIEHDEEQVYLVLKSIKEETNPFYKSQGCLNSDGSLYEPKYSKYHPSFYLDFDSIQEMQDFALEILLKTFKYNSAHQKSKILSDLKNSK